jgi:drug/metabolite transporter (DMT)-like permease
MAAPEGAKAAGAKSWMPTLSMQQRAELAIAGVCFIWGSSFVVVKRAFADASPMVFTALRFCVALAALLAVYARDLQREHARGALYVGVLLFCGFTLQTAGLARTTPSRSAFLTALCIPLTPLFQCALFRRRPRLADVIGACCAALGTFLLTGGGKGEGSGSSFNAGDVLSLGCAIVFAFHMIALNHWGSGAGFVTTAVGQVAVTAVLSALLCAVFETPYLRVTGAVVLAIAATGLLATALAFTVLAWAQTHTSATRAAIICSTGALCSLPLSCSYLTQRHARRVHVCSLLLVRCQRRGAVGRGAAGRSLHLGQHCAW